MKADRKRICEIISNMLDNPDKNGIYPTSTAYTELEYYIELVRMETLGWAIADACTSLDAGDDPRLMEVPVIISRMRRDIGGL